MGDLSPAYLLCRYSAAPWSPPQRAQMSAVFAQEARRRACEAAKHGKGSGEQTTPNPELKRFRLSASFCKGLRLCPTFFLNYKGAPAYLLCRYSAAPWSPPQRAPMNAVFVQEDEQSIVYDCEVRLATKTVFHWTSGFAQEREQSIVHDCEARLAAKPFPFPHILYYIPTLTTIFRPYSARPRRFYLPLFVYSSEFSFSS